MSFRSLPFPALCLVVTGASLVLACKREPKASQVEAPVTAEASASNAASSAKPGVKTFGAALKPAQVSALSEVLGNPERYKDAEVTVEGHVRRACSKKGCWMELSTGSDASAQACRVSFKNYGFFVPTDSAGSKAKVQGHVELATVKAAHVNHLEQEGATFAAKSPDGTAQEVRLVADGVELWR